MAPKNKLTEEDLKAQCYQQAVESMKRMTK